MPPWIGVLGNSLTTAANSYLRALIDKPFEDLALEKARLTNEGLKSRQELERAQSDWYMRRLSGGSGAGRPIIRQLPDGTHVLYDPALEEFVPIPGSQARAPRTLNPQQKFDQGLMDQLELELGHGPPWTYEELNRPKTRPLVDQLRKVPQIYSGPTGFTTAEEIRDYFKNNPQGPPAVPAPARSPQTGAPASTGPASRVTPGPGDVAGEADPLIVKHHVTRWQKMPQAEVDKQWQILRSDKLTQPVVLASAAQAYHELFGTPPPGFQAQTEGTAATPPPVPSQQPGPAAEGPRTVPGRDLRTAQTSGQRKAEEYKDTAETRAQEHAARQQRLDLIGGQITKDQEITTNRLFTEGKIKSRYYSELAPEEAELVNATNRAPKLAEEQRKAQLAESRMQAHHLKLLKEAKPYMDELQGLQATRDLVEQIVPLVKSGNIGLKATGRTIVDAGKSLIGLSPSYEKLVNEQLTKAGLDPTINELQARMLTQLVEMKDLDPAVKQRLMNIAPQARLKTLAAVLIYAHAMAVKRTFGQTERGLIGSDMKFAGELFDPERIWSSPDILLTNLGTLDKQIQRAVPILQQRVRMYYIDPKNGKILPGAPTGEESGPASEEKLEILRGP